LLVGSQSLKRYEARMHGNLQSWCTSGHW
jgi:hypothetical protein